MCRSFHHHDSCLGDPDCEPGGDWSSACNRLRMGQNVCVASPAGYVEPDEQTKHFATTITAAINAFVRRHTK